VIIARQYYLSQYVSEERRLQLEGWAERRVLEKERDKLRDELTGIQPDYEALKRLGVYTDHFLNVIDSIFIGELTLNNFPKDRDPRIKAAFCLMPHEHIATVARQDIRFSLWIEAKDKLRRGTFDVAFAPNHEQQEVPMFSVRIKDTWLHQAQEDLRRHPNSTRLHRIDDLDIAGLFGDDLHVFRELGYRSVRAFSFDFQAKPVRLVALSKQAGAFSRMEDRYLLLLWLALTIAAQNTSLVAT
jgi:hypothetical protein